MQNKSTFLNPKSGEKRKSFRIDDTLSVIVRKIEKDTISSELEISEDDFKEGILSFSEKENIPLTLWKLLVRIDKKLDRVMGMMPIDLTNMKECPVNLSASGMKIKVKKRFYLDESVRIKILLPTLPVKELDIVGEVVRIEALSDGNFEVALHFQKMDDTVKDEIIHYTINQQRKAIAAQRRKRSQDESDRG